jgi:hypothetical protein
MTVKTDNTTTIGKAPASKNPRAMISETKAATAGDINIAMKIGTWLAKVKEAGSITNLNGEYIGIMMPIALSRAAIVIVFTLFTWFVIFVTYPSLINMISLDSHDSCLVSCNYN